MTGRPPVAPEIRFWAKVKKTRFCWIWMAHRDKRGYGYFGSDTSGRMVRAHKWAWEQENGRVPEGMVLDHICNRPRCVRPSHLRVCTPAENVLRSKKAITAINARKQVCKRGHDDWVKNHRQRHCRTCDRERARRYRARKVGTS